jgi:dipeptide/tripeptide permease
MNPQPTTGLTWRFPKTFWVANVIELFERAAYYGMFIALTLFLTREVGFTDIETGFVTAFFASALYLAPTFTGSLADRLGFRRSILLAFGLLTVGYAALGAFPTKPMAMLSLFVIMVGGSFVKPIISGTIAKTSDETNRSRAFSLFYAMVNIGAFAGKSIAKPLRTELGLETINYYAASMALCAFVIALVFYKDQDTRGVGKSSKEMLQGLLRVFRNGRFMSLILIIAGFWAIQGQLYSTMPKYTLRLVGEQAAPEWLANINPFVVVLLVVPVTHLVRKMAPIRSIGIALLIIPFSSLVVAMSPVLQRLSGPEVSFGSWFSLHPITVTLILGIALQGLSECFLSPRWLEYASKQAPPGEEGLYMGYSHLTTFFAWLFGFIASGYLLDRYCPDPRTLTPEQLPSAYDQAHFIWFYFAGLGAAAFLALLLFQWITREK